MWQGSGIIITDLGRFFGQLFFRYANVFGKSATSTFRQIAVDLITDFKGTHVASQSFDFTGNVYPGNIYFWIF